MKVVKINQINEIVSVLRSGGVVALPTDTAYALASDATNPQAVNKIFTIKRRKPDKLLSWFFIDIKQIKKLATLSHDQLSFLQSFLPGPYTFIVPGKNGQTIGARITNHPITQQVVKAYGKPLTATSANIAGQPPLRTIEELKKLSVDCIVDGGSIPNRPSSTVVDLTGISPKVIRPGAAPFPTPFSK